jgi:hypothetical protein
VRRRTAAVRMQRRAADARAAARGQHHVSRWRCRARRHSTRQGHQIWPLCSSRATLGHPAPPPHIAEAIKVSQSDKLQVRRCAVFCREEVRGCSRCIICAAGGAQGRLISVAEVLWTGLSLAALPDPRHQNRNTGASNVCAPKGASPLIHTCAAQSKPGVAAALY